MTTLTITKTEAKREDETFLKIWEGITERFYYLGQQLKRMRDLEVFRALGFETMGDYVRDRIGKSHSWATETIDAYQAREAVPPPPDFGVPKSGWNVANLRPLTRIRDEKKTRTVRSKDSTREVPELDFEKIRKVGNRVNSKLEKAAKEGKPIRITAKLVEQCIEEHEERYEKPKPPKKKAPTRRASPDPEPPKKEVWKVINAIALEVEYQIEQFNEIPDDLRAIAKREAAGKDAFKRLRDAATQLLELTK